MSTPHDFDRTAQAWLAEGPIELADRVLDAALDEVHLTHQRRWMALGRTAQVTFLSSNMTRLAAAAVVAIVAVGGALYVLSGNGGVGSQGPTSAPPNAPTPTPAIARFSCAARTVTWDGSSAIDLTGTWSGDDEGVYYLRQIGDQVWWLGMSGIGGPLVNRGADWTNVYRGTLSGDTITGTYADVPGGRIQDNGPVILKLTSTSGGGISLVRTDPLLSTGFGGTLLTPCTLG